MNKIIITGAAGFIGSNLVDYLASRRYKILAVDNFSSGKIENTKDFPSTVEVADVLDYTKIEVLFNKFRPNTVLHLAAQPAITTSFQDPMHDLNVNAMGTLTLIELSKKYDVNKFILSSTSAVYGRAGSRMFPVKESDPCRPDTPYGVSKLAAEHYVRTLFSNHVILRYANVYGPRQVPLGENQLIARALSHLKNGLNFHVVGQGNQSRDFIYVEDVCNANWFFLNEYINGTFNICTGKSYSVNEVVNVISDKCGIRGYPWEHSGDSDLRGSVYISPTYTKKIGWFSMIPMEKGLQKTIDWWNIK